MAQHPVAPSSHLPTTVVSVENLRVVSVSVVKPKSQVWPESPFILFRVAPYQHGQRTDSTTPEEAEMPPGWLNSATVDGSVHVLFMPKKGNTVDCGHVKFTSPNPDTVLDLQVPINDRLVQLVGESWTSGRFILDFQSLVVCTQVVHHHDEPPEMRVTRVGGGGPYVLEHDGKGNVGKEISIPVAVLEEIRSALLSPAPVAGIHDQKLVEIRKRISECRASKATLLLRTYITDNLCEESHKPENEAPKYVIRATIRSVKIDHVDGRAKDITERVLKDMDWLLKSILDILNAHSHDDKVTDEPDPATIDFAWKSVVSVVTYLSS
ncbi:MAG: hypothetical protein JRN54_02785 [Nitrososphaerota archaeon]|nr:hypothetical protein [Nitrososphaerota archaeon]